jgi:hypothetical protein
MFKLVELEELERIAIEFIKRKMGDVEVEVQSITPWTTESWFVSGDAREHKKLKHKSFTLSINKEGKVYSYKFGNSLKS